MPNIQFAERRQSFITKTMDINWLLIGSYLTVLIIANFLPIVTIFAGITGIPIALITKNAYLSQVFGYALCWTGIAWLWTSLNNRSFPIIIPLIMIVILSIRFKRDRSLDLNGQQMVVTERISLILVAIGSSLIFGFSWY